MRKGSKLCFQDVLCCFKPPQIPLFEVFLCFSAFDSPCCQLIPPLSMQGRGGLVPTLLQFVPVSSQHPNTPLAQGKESFCCPTKQIPPETTQTKSPQWGLQLGTASPSLPWGSSRSDNSDRAVPCPLPCSSTQILAPTHPSGTADT